MEYRLLGRTGIKVSPLCLGSMNWDAHRPDVGEEGVRCVRAALERGINFIDTANVYWNGGSEEVVGEAIAGHRDEVVLATKVWGPMGGGPLERGNSRRHLIQQCEASLHRLRTDWIDLYQLHRPDPDTPIEESLMALDDLVRQGKVRHVGFSTFPAWETMEAIALADRRNLASSPACEQPPYNILDRRIEIELIPLALKYGIGIIPWSPLASGLLTGKYNDGLPEGARATVNPPMRERPQFAGAVEATRRLAKLASDAGLTMVQLALGWLMQQPAVTSPIIGPKNLTQLDENLAALDVTIDANTAASIDAVVAPGEAAYPLT